MSELSEARFHIFPTDCDMLGHLNHATMLSFLERARWMLLEPHVDLRSWGERPAFSVVRHVDIGYHAQCFPGEDLLIRSGLLDVRNTSYIVRQEVHREKDRTLVAEANIVFVAVDRSGKPVRVPDDWRRMLPQWPNR